MLCEEASQVFYNIRAVSEIFVLLYRCLNQNSVGGMK
jgi:hypothetical protein